MPWTVCAEASAMVISDHSYMSTHVLIARAIETGDVYPSWSASSFDLETHKCLVHFKQSVSCQLCKSLRLHVLVCWPCRRLTVFVAVHHHRTSATSSQLVSSTMEATGFGGRFAPIASC